MSSSSSSSSSASSSSSSSACMDTDSPCTHSKGHIDTTARYAFCCDGCGMLKPVGAIGPWSTRKDYDAQVAAKEKKREANNKLRDSGCDHSYKREIYALHDGEPYLYAQLCGKCGWMFQIRETPEELEAACQHMRHDSDVAKGAQAKAGQIVFRCLDCGYQVRHPYPCLMFAPKQKSSS